MFTIGEFSAHADQADLLEWMSHVAERPGPQVFIIHGESTSSEAQADAIRERLGLKISEADMERLSDIRDELHTVAAG